MGLTRYDKSEREKFISTRTKVRELTREVTAKRALMKKNVFKILCINIKKIGKMYTVQINHRTVCKWNH